MKRKRHEGRDVTMTTREEKLLREMIQPIASQVTELFIKALILRCNVHQQLALMNGAEPEDMGEVVSLAIESSVEVTKQWMDDIGEMKMANAINEGKL